MKTLLTNIGELVTLAPLTKNSNSAITESQLGIIKNAWLSIEGGKISDYGRMDQFPDRDFKAFHGINLEGKLVMPGLVDCHTHPIFAGERDNEFAMRLAGKTYQEIAALGGGISATVSATRKASSEELQRLTQDRFMEFLEYGVTTVEAKSGYGLSFEEEIRHLKILSHAKHHTPQDIVITCLALHAVPNDKSKEDYIKEACEKIIPYVAKEGLAEFADAFVEKGYFSPEDAQPYLQAAQKHGLGIRLHADEFQDSDAAQLAAEYDACSADHLQAAPQKAILELAKNDVVAVLLPGTSLYTSIPYAKAAPFLEAGCQVALATDFNPGSCVANNLPMIATLGAIHCGLTFPEAIAAVTYMAAKSLKREKTKGALAIGYDADFMIHGMKSCQQWIADLGRHKPKSVWIKGQKVLSAS